jgi:hypothetical protein
MKLSEKYELAELLSSGRVSTFLARERATQEQVLVHTFECDGPNPPTSTAAILTRFVSLAPNPPGVVLKAGFDEVSSSAYLVTKMPDQSVLQEWIRAYRSFTTAAGGGISSTASATSQIGAGELEERISQAGRPKGPVPAEFQPAPTATEPFARPEPTPPASQSPGEFTRLFRELGSFPSAPARTAPGSAPDAVPSGPVMVPPVSSPLTSAADREPGEITKLFSAAKKKTDFGSLASATDAGVPEAKEPGEFTRQFQAVSEQFRGAEAKPGPVREEIPPKPASPFSTNIFGPSTPPSAGASDFDHAVEERVEERKSAGEFTKFFRGPFDQPSAPSKPIVVPDEPPMRAPREQVGDFTRLFGKGPGVEAEPPSFATPQPEPPRPPGSFTQLFGPDSLKGAGSGPATPDANASGLIAAPPSAKPATAPPAPTVQPPSPIVPPSPPIPMPQFTPPVIPPVVSPVIPMVTPAAVAPSVVSRAEAAAIDVSRAPGGDAVPPEPRAPSEFTMFITRKDLEAAQPPEPSEEPVSAAVGGGFAPKVPKLAVAPLPVPKLPPVPKPKLQVPKVPGAGAAPPTSFWPLITVFTGLLAIGAMLVMYFLLRH